MPNRGISSRPVDQNGCVGVCVGILSESLQPHCVVGCLLYVPLPAPSSPWTWDGQILIETANTPLWVTTAAAQNKRGREKPGPGHGAVSRPPPLGHAAGAT